MDGPYARCGSVKRVTIGVGQAMLVSACSTTSTLTQAVERDNVGDDVWQRARTLLVRWMALWRLAIARGSGRSDLVH